MPNRFRNLKNLVDYMDWLKRLEAKFHEAVEAFDPMPPDIAQSHDRILFYRLAEHIRLHGQHLPTEWGAVKHGLADSLLLDNLPLPASMPETDGASASLLTAPGVRIYAASIGRNFPYRVLFVEGNRQTLVDLHDRLTPPDPSFKASRDCPCVS